MLHPITLSPRVNAGTCTGSCEIVLQPDGRVQFSGHVHNSGALAARYMIITSFTVPGVGPVIIAHRGHAGGTLSVDIRDSDWDLSDRSVAIATIGLP